MKDDFKDIIHSMNNTNKSLEDIMKKINIATTRYIIEYSIVPICFIILNLAIFVPMVTNITIAIIIIIINWITAYVTLYIVKCILDIRSITMDLVKKVYNSTER